MKVLDEYRIVEVNKKFHIEKRRRKYNWWRKSEWIWDRINRYGVVYPIHMNPRMPIRPTLPSIEFNSLKEARKFLRKKDKPMKKIIHTA